MIIRSKSSGNDEYTHNLEIGGIFEDKCLEVLRSKYGKTEFVRVYGRKNQKIYDDIKTIPKHNHKCRCFECKFDLMSRGFDGVKYDSSQATNQFYIEIQSHNTAWTQDGMSYKVWTKSGIYAPSMASHYLIGDLDQIYIFPFSLLRDKNEFGSYRIVYGNSLAGNPTKGYLLPLADIPDKYLLYRS